MEMTPRLQVAVCTVGQRGLDRLAAKGLPAVPGVAWLLSVQQWEGEALPAELQRVDIAVTHAPGLGLSRNRTHSLRASTAELVLLADDDLEHSPAALQALIEAFDAHPEADFLICRHTGPQGLSGGDDGWAIERATPPSVAFASFDVAVRGDVARRGPAFDERFGIGSTLWGCGEEQVYMLTLRRLGYRGRYVPLTLCHHAGETTAQRRATPAVLRGHGAYIAWEWPWTGLLRLPLKAWREWRRGRAALGSGLWRLLQGWCVAKISKRSWQR